MSKLNLVPKLIEIFIINKILPRVTATFVNKREYTARSEFARIPKSMRPTVFDPPIIDGSQVASSVVELKGGARARSGEKCIRLLNFKIGQTIFLRETNLPKMQKEQNIPTRRSHQQVRGSRMLEMP